MTDQKTVEALIDKLADKTLSFGIKIKLSEASEYCPGINIEDEVTFCGDFWQKYKNSKKTYNKHMGIKNREVVDIGALTPFDIIGHPVIIGDVLERIKTPDFTRISRQIGGLFSLPLKIGKLVYLWWFCGFRKSLNQIVEESGFEQANFEKIIDGKVVAKWNEQLKEPNARKLVEFIISLNLK